MMVLKMDKKRALIMFFVAVAFISVVAGGIFLMIAALKSINLFIYISIGLILFGIIIYAVLLILLTKTIKEKK